ncbi:hypothetical protein BRD00_12465 [Halobacteriales archaeon QS_8_69_26]|nr:MAG: hypothetical protein BRD00_12465 [Halobacteriales archaeon QS_8_69_26]
MSTDGQERTAVRTYVPAAQKAEWEDHADRMDVTLSEFVRTMVQAGRADFPVPSTPGAENDEAGSSGPADTTTGGQALEDRILDVLRSGDPVDPDELVAAVTRDMEDRVYEALDDLDESGRVKFDPRAGGYTLDDGE